MLNFTSIMASPLDSGHVVRHALDLTEYLKALAEQLYMLLAIATFEARHSYTTS